MKKSSSRLHTQLGQWFDKWFYYFAIAAAIPALLIAREGCNQLRWRWHFESGYTHRLPWPPPKGYVPPIRDDLDFWLKRHEHVVFLYVFNIAVCVLFVAIGYVGRRRNWKTWPRLKSAVVGELIPLCMFFISLWLLTIKLESDNPERDPYIRLVKPGLSDGKKH